MGWKKVPEDVIMPVANSVCFLSHWLKSGLKDEVSRTYVEFNSTSILLIAYVSRRNRKYSKTGDENGYRLQAISK